MEREELIEVKNAYQKELSTTIAEEEKLKTIKDRIHFLKGEISEINRKLTKIDRQEFEGTFWKVKPGKKSVDGVIAFKILEILDAPNEAYAVCLCITKNEVLNAFSSYELSIRRKVFHLWIPVVNRIITNPDDEKVIERYDEMSSEEFKNVFNKTLEELNSHL